MLYNIKLFAFLKDVIGKSEVTIEAPRDLTKQQFIEYFCQQYPPVFKYASRLKMAYDFNYLSEDDIIADNKKEIAIFPTVSGG